MITIVHPYGETIRHRITVKNSVEDIPALESGDVVYLVIRDRGGDLLWWHTYEPQLIDGAWCFDWEISHDEAEEKLHPERYKWGFSIYRDATLEEGRPVDGTVIIPVSEADLVITRAISREEK
jgi:hypothetical protein